MKIQPRQQLLDIWRAVARATMENGEWQWGGRRKSNCISDTEQLLCLMYPTTEVQAFRLDQPDETAEDVIDALSDIGDALEIPRVLVHVLGQYLDTYTTEVGAPSFGGGTYFYSADPDREPTPDQTGLNVVDGYSMSVTLMLAVIDFIRTFSQAVRREDLRNELKEVEAKASKRLSAAMVGLLRSFATKVFTPDSEPGQTLINTVNQSGLPDRVVVDRLREDLKEIRARILEFTIGSGQPTELENPNRLFECGWAWGVVKDAPEIDIKQDVGPQPPGVAHNDPYLYFTVVALDGIADLFSERTTVLGLLNDEQVRLAQALRLRWELTQRYWATIGGTGRERRERWALEDLPWRTTDGKESDYFSLLVTSMVVENLVGRRATDPDLRRVAAVLEELAERGRVTRRALDADPALGLHYPGVSLELRGSDDTGGPMLQWIAGDYSAVLLKRALGLSQVARSTELRDPLLSLADKIWTHIQRRRIQRGQGRDLWDDPRNVYSGVGEVDDLPSWYHTERVVECLVGATNLLDDAPLRSNRLIESALDLLNEAEHLFDSELLRGTTRAGRSLRDSLQQMQANLVRAREIIRDRPGTALVLASEVLRDLDRLEVARRDAEGAN